MKRPEKKIISAVPCKLGAVGDGGGLTVLHVDDDPNDTALLQAASVKANVDFILQNVEDAEEAIAYLSGLDKYADRAKYRVPALVLLDLKLPRSTGFEILKWIRNDPLLHDIPIVVLSGSELQEDIRNAYAGGANSYLVKPLGFNALVDLIKSISSVWLASNSPASGMPPRRASSSIIPGTTPKYPPAPRV
jgi:CheY-like chemotaxis protein